MRASACRSARHSGHFQAALIRAMASVLIAVPIASLVMNAVALVRYGIDIPFWDDWRQYDSGDLGSLDLRYLFTPVNDTLYPVGRFLDSLAVRWLDGHSVAYQLVSLIAVLGALLGLQWRLLSLCVASPLIRALAFSFTLLMLQPDSYWGLQNLAFHQAIPLVCVLGMLCIALSPNGKPLWAVPAAFLLSLISGFSYISGAFAALALGVVLVAAAYRWPTHGVRLRQVGLAVLVPGVVCVLAQLWVIVFVQQGTHLPDVSMAYPWQSDFWWYILGKVGRALMLDGMPVGFAAVLTVGVIALLGLLTIRAMRSSRAELALIWCALVAIVGIYLALVAAGRANMRPESVESPLQIYAFAFGSFHYFWATLLWPWVIVGVLTFAQAGGTKLGRSKQSAVAATAGLILLMLLGYGDAFAHAQHYRSVMALRQQGIECLNEKIGRGHTPLTCPTLHPPDSPELLPTDLTQSIRHAIEQGVSFTRLPHFPPMSGTASDRSPFFRLDAAAQDLMFEGVQRSYETAHVPAGSALKLLSTGNDPSIRFSTGQAEMLKQCRILDLVGEAILMGPDGIQLFYIPGEGTHYTERHSRIAAYQGPGAETFTIRVASPTGFLDQFRLDPGTRPGAIELNRLELKCLL